jgi:3-oxoacyl-[acyl-carrier-protein] synthase-3
MAELLDVGIAGLGSYAPEKVVTNDDLAERVETSDEWVFQRTGIRERRVIGPDECSGSMATIASRRAIEDAD